MSNLYLVKSPLQQLNAIEASTHFGGEDEVLIIKYSENQRSNEQLKNMLSLKEWSVVYEIAHSKIGIGLLKELQLIRKLAKGNKKFERIFLGDYRSKNYLLFAQNIDCDEVILLDDGTATFYIQEKYLESNANFSNGIINDTARNIFSTLLGLKRKIDKRINLFSCYNLKPHAGQVIHRNEYNFMQAYISKEDIEYDSNLLLFVGAKYIEAGWMDSDTFFNALEKVFALYPNKKKIYVPHRGESEEKLEEIVKRFNVELLRYDIIIELGILHGEKIPKYIIGFTSSALVNIHKMYEGVNTVSYRISNNDILPTFQNTMCEFYHQFESSEKLNVIDL